MSPLFPSEYENLRMKVHELMSRDVLALPETATVYEVLAKMTEYAKSCVVICLDDIPVGIVTERDIVKLYCQQVHEGKIQDMSVDDIMTHEPICTFENSDVYEALLIARSHRVRHIPVINDEDRLVGLLTQNDTLEAYLTAWETTAELQEVNKHLKLLSLEDSLLQIGNRRALNIDLNHIEAASKRSNTRYSIAMIDVDNFKLFNDYYGHQAGDEALVKLVKAMELNKRDGDRIYRYGGEEILLVMPDTNIPQATAAADRIRQAIEELAIPHSKSHYGVVTVSIGVASDQTQSWKDIVKYADAALYEAKNSGKNRTFAH